MPASSPNSAPLRDASRPSSSDLVLTFLESVGKRQDAELYLRLFRQVPKASFALVSVDSSVLNEAMGLMVDGLHFLSRLNLYPVLVRGFDRGQQASLSPAMQSEFERELKHRGLDLVTHSSSSPNVVRNIIDDIEHERAVCVDFSNDPGAAGFEALGSLAVALQSRKLVLLRSRGGLGPKDSSLVRLSATHVLQTDENGIGVVNLRTDYAQLVSTTFLDEEERHLLERISALHQNAATLVTSVTSPLNLLRELFTVRGAGTLIKTGSDVRRVNKYADLDLPRLAELIETSFGRALHPRFLQRRPLNIYFEEGYRGAAIVQPGIERDSAYLTKFAVVRSAQGEGLGRDLWEAVVRDYPSLYWRARTSNPISAWYSSQCDGMNRVGDWCVYWRGVPIQRVPALSEDALHRPHDLV